MLGIFTKVFLISINLSFLDSHTFLSNDAFNLFYILETAENLSTFSRDLAIDFLIPDFLQCPYGEGQR